MVCISHIHITALFSEIYLMDATFDVVPKLYRQLWVIHSRYNGNKVLPFAYFLLPDKLEQTYRRALELLVEQMEPVTQTFRLFRL